MRFETQEVGRREAARRLAATFGPWGLLGLIGGALLLALVLMAFGCGGGPSSESNVGGPMLDWRACGPLMATINRGRGPEGLMAEANRAMQAGWQPFWYMEHYNAIVMVRDAETPCREVQR